MSIFRTVTGSDFARSIAWARRQPPNPITEKLKSMKTATPKITVIARAKFFSSGRFIAPGSPLEQQGFKNSPNSVINAAEVEFNGIRLLSRVPQSAAEAEKINRALGA